MKKIFYTQDGTPYILKTISKNQTLTTAGATFGKTVYVNYSPDDSKPLSAELSLDLQSQNPIVPLAFTISALDDVNAEAVDIAQMYYGVSQGNNGSPYPTYRLPLGKAIPYIQRVYLTDVLNNSFSLQYNQLVFSDSDFLNPNNKLLISFYLSVAEAMNNQVASGNSFIIPAGVYNVTSSFTYYEMLKHK